MSMIVLFTFRISATCITGLASSRRHHAAIIPYVYPPTAISRAAAWPEPSFSWLWALILISANKELVSIYIEPIEPCMFTYMTGKRCSRPFPIPPSHRRFTPQSDEVKGRYAAPNPVNGTWTDGITWKHVRPAKLPVQSKTWHGEAIFT